MKKSLLIAALAVFTMASCSKDQVVETPQNEIKYNVLAANKTKASQVYGSGKLMGSFQVWGGYTADGTTFAPYFSNEAVTAQGDKWVPGSTRYWPELGSNKELSFYAIAGFTKANSGSEYMIYADANSATWAGARQPVVVGFTPNPDVTKQEDFLYSVYNQKEAVTSVTTAKMNFRHALSQIEFQAKNTSDHLYVTISGVAVGQVSASGNFTFPVGSTDENWTWNDKPTSETEGSEDTDVSDNTVNVGTWALNSTKEDYVVNFTAVPVNNDGNVVGLTRSSGYETSGNSLLLLPHTAATDAWTGTATVDGTYIAVKCKIYNIAGDSYAEGDVLLHDGWAVIPVSFTWNPGKRYIYTILFGNGDGGYEGGEGDDPEPGKDPVLLPIEYEVSVDDFDRIVELESEFKTNK